MTIKSKIKNQLTAERLRSILSYDPETGVFTWRLSNGKRAISGEVAGGASGEGYVRISINNSRYFAHRLAWLYVYSEWPKDQIDHINSEKSDNRIVNLREANHSQNGQNRRNARSDCQSGLIGVYLSKSSGRWGAVIVKEGKKHSLGCFDTKASAHNAYLAAKRELHEFGEAAKGVTGYLPVRELKGRQIDAKHGTESGVLGVSRIPKNGKWKARISINGVSKHLGCFDTAEAAGEAYQVSRRELLGSD